MPTTPTDHGVRARRNWPRCLFSLRYRPLPDRTLPASQVTCLDAGAPHRSSTTLGCAAIAPHKLAVPGLRCEESRAIWCTARPFRSHTRSVRGQPAGSRRTASQRRGSVVDPTVLVDDPRSGSAVVPGLSGSPTACFVMPASGSGTGAVVKGQGTVWRRAFFEAGAVQCGELVDDCPCELNRG